jgi:hypothetical protein
VGADESRDAIAYQVGNFAVNLETPGAVGRSLTTMVTHGLPDDYYTQLRVELTRMGKPELDTAALTYIHPDELSIVVEADLAAVGAEVEATGLGEVSIVDTADLLANT